MEYILMISLLIVGFISFIPVSKMVGMKKNNKYRCLKYLINITFSWTIIILLERLVSNEIILYYIHMLSYPIKLLLGIAMFCTIFNYIEKKMPKILLILFGVLVLAEIILALTNNTTQLILNIDYNSVQNIEDIYNASKGVLFIYHLMITYLVLLSSVVYLFAFLGKNKSIVQYKEITRTMAYSTILVLAINLSQLLFIKTTIDLTYISLVIVVYALYHVIYAKDMMFNLRTSGRGEILSNMREMYIITDQEKRIVEISELLRSKYNLSEEFLGIKLDELYGFLDDRVVFYSDIDVKSSEASDKDHLHMREKKFQLNGMNQYGYMILLYDETQVFNLLRELNKLSNFDTMTGLNNRNYIESLLEGIKSTNKMGVVSLDLNGLKINNDYLGHERGDYLLKKISNIMKSEMTHIQNKEMARIGGDEFIVIVYNTSEEQLKSIKEKILDKGKNNDVENELSVSIGYAIGSSNNENVFHLIQKADEEMYSMKRESSKLYKERMIIYLEKIGKFIR